MSDASDHELDFRVGELVADAIADAPEAPELPTGPRATGEGGERRRSRWGLLGAMAGAGAAAAIIAAVVLPGVGDESIREIDPADTPPIETDPVSPATTATAAPDTTVSGVVPGPDPEPVVPLVVRADDVPSFIERLAMIPDHPAFRNEVLLADIDVATELAGIDRPDAGDDGATITWYSSITGGRPPTTSGVQAWSIGPMWLGAQATDDDPDPARELGIELSELAWSAHSNMYPNFAVTGGRIDPERVRSAADDELDGTFRFGRTDWFESDMEQRTQLRGFGWPIAAALVDDTMVISFDPDLVRPARVLDGDTLADVEPFRAAAEVFDRSGAYSARLFSNPDQPSALGSTLDAVGTGLIVTAAGDREVHLVIVADETTVAAAIELVVDRIDQGTISLTDEPWRNKFRVRSTTVDGQLGIIRLQQEPNTTVPDFLIEQLLYDPLED